MALPFTASPRAWQWILEKLVDNKNVGTPIVKGLAGYVPDIEESECRPLVRRMALRYLEEAIVKNRIDVTAIPLVASACSFESDNSSCRDVIAQKMRDRKLLHRVKIEAVISCVRQTQPDWSAFLETLNAVFPLEDLSPVNQTQRNELLSVFKSKDIHMIPLDANLRKDLSLFTQQKQKILDKPVLDQLANSYVQTMSVSNGRMSGGREEPHVVRPPDADFINNAKAMLGLGPGTAGDPPRRPESMQKQMCVESKEDGAESPRNHEAKVGVKDNVVRTRDVEGTGQGTEACNGMSSTVSVQSDALTEIVYFGKQQGKGQVDQRKRLRESLDSDDATHAIGDGGAAARFHSGCRARMNGNSRTIPLKRMTGKCYQCNMGGGLLFCDSCKASYHLECLAQQLTCNWTCPDCGKICTVPASKLLLPPPPMGKLNGTVREPSASGAAALADCGASSDPIAHGGGDVYAAHVSTPPHQKDVGGCSATEPTLLGSPTHAREGITMNASKSGLQETTIARQMGVEGCSGTRSGENTNNGNGSSVGKRACSSDDDDVQILESISCKRPKVINLEECFKTAGLKTITGRDGVEHCPPQPTCGGLTVEAVAVEHAVEVMVGEAEESAERLIVTSDSQKVERKRTASFSEPGNREAERCQEGEESDAVDLEMKKLTETLSVCRGQDGHDEVCHLCGDAGTMISCEACPIAMHKSCLGLDQCSVDESGKWLCPYCVRKKAMQALVQAREATKLAQRQLLDAEKALAALKDRPTPRQEQRQMQGPECSSAGGPHSSPGAASKEVELFKVPPVEQAEGEKGKVFPGATAGSEEHQAASDAGGDAPSPVCGGSSGCESPKRGASDERHDGERDPTSRTSKAHRKLSSGRKAVPGLRRKALPWTTEEEQVLREGVARFSKDGTWGYQWQRILEFGAGKFDRSRTGVDLKDKWRNMQRRAGSPSLR